MKNIIRTCIAAAVLLSAGIAGSQALAGGTQQSSYDKIVAQQSQVNGDPVNLRSNYWLAWTGAWDTVVMKETRLWEKWLPAGSQITWQRNLQGPPVITDLLSGKQQIGYIGDNPAIVSTTKLDIAPVNLVAVNTISPGRMCGHLILGKDAPDFSNYKDAIKWLEGKTIGVPRGSCADRLAQVIMNQEGIHVTWQQMQAEVVVTSLQAGKIDAAAVYEPHSSKAVFDGYAKYAISSNPFHELDANAIVMRQDFIESNRDVAKAWLKANIEALYFLKEHPLETIEMVKKELPGYTRENLWHAIYGNLPKETGASDTVLIGAMSFTKDVRDLLQRGHDFLHEINVVVEPQFDPKAIQDDLITEAFKELGLDPDQPLFVIKEGDMGSNPFKGDELIKS